MSFNIFNLMSSVSSFLLSLQSFSTNIFPKSYCDICESEVNFFNKYTLSIQNCYVCRNDFQICQSCFPKMICGRFDCQFSNTQI